MQDDARRTALAESLARLRREAGYTQAELGEKLNYSDKSVSKWERGEGAPDVFVLEKIADIYGVSMDALLDRTRGDDAKTPAPTPAPAWRHRGFLLAAAFCAVWLVALIAYTALSLAKPETPGAWFVFMYALPACFFVCAVLLTIWKARFLYCYIAYSAALWCITLCVFLSVAIRGRYLLFIVMAAVQLLSVVVLALFKRPARGEG